MANATVLGLVPKIGTVPVPVSTTVCGLPLTLSVIVSEAVRLPVAPGVNVTFTVVVLPGVTVIVGVPAVKAKSPAFAPVSARAVIDKFAVPVFVSVIAVPELAVLTSWLPKLTLAGLIPMPGAVPVPVSTTVCGLPLALSVIVSEDRTAARSPRREGHIHRRIARIAASRHRIGNAAAVKAKSAAFCP